MCKKHKRLETSPNPTWQLSLLGLRPKVTTKNKLQEGRDMRKC